MVHLGHQLELRCWDGTDAVKAKPTELPSARLTRIGDRIA